MHIDDAHDDKMVAEETTLQVHTRAQSRAAQTVSIIEAASSSPCPDPTADPIDQFTESVMPPRSAHTSARATDEITIHDNLDDFSELVIARALLKHSLEFVLPAHYKPDDTGEMRVVGVDALKLTKSNAVLIVKFLSPQSLRDATMQMYCTSLKSNVVSVKAKISGYSLHSLTLNLCMTLQSANCPLQVSLAL